MVVPSQIENRALLCFKHSQITVFFGKLWSANEKLVQYFNFLINCVYGFKVKSFEDFRMKIAIFLVCYNEELLLPLTLKHYKTRFPSAEIYLLDNCSTDNSCKIAEDHGCKIVTYESGDRHDESVLMNLRSHKYEEFVKDSWVIMCDMDEWLDMTEEQLQEEESKGVTVITTQGVNMVGESKTTDLSDIDLNAITKGFYDDNFSKRVCFKYPEVHIDYWYGAHICFPFGRVQYSERTYYLRHYNYLGAEYLADKHKRRYLRNIQNIPTGINGHYLKEKDESYRVYEECLGRAIEIHST